MRGRSPNSSDAQLTELGLRPRIPSVPILGCWFQDAAAYLVELHRLEQRLEVALAEALVALPLDDLEEDRADGGLGEDLQQQPRSEERRVGKSVGLGDR